MNSIVSIYEGKEKKYNVHTRRKLNLKAWILLLIIPTICLITFGLICINKSLVKETDYKLSYDEKMSTDYKVYLKENDDFEESFLPSNIHQQYIAGIISTINVNFNYQMHSTKAIDYDYEYSIIAKVLLTDRTNPTEIIKEDTQVLVNEKKELTDSKDIVIYDDVDIDYNKYNTYASDFKNKYGLNAISKLVVRMEIKTNGEISKIDKNINNGNSIEVVIPLLENTFNITKPTGIINRNDTISGKEIKKIDNNFLLVFGIILCVLSLVMLILALYLYFTTKKKKDIYEHEVNKILKEYDRLIASTHKKPNIDETKFKNKIRVSNIEELVDVCERLHQPIIYYEVEPNEKSYFVVISDDSLYKLTISRAWLQKNKSK